MLMIFVKSVFPHTNLCLLFNCFVISCLYLLPVFFFNIFFHFVQHYFYVRALGKYCTSKARVELSSWAELDSSPWPQLESSCFRGLSSSRAEHVAAFVPAAPLVCSSLLKPFGQNLHPSRLLYSLQLPFVALLIDSAFATSDQLDSS